MTRIPSSLSDGGFPTGGSAAGKPHPRPPGPCPWPSPVWCPRRQRLPVPPRDGELPVILIPGTREDAYAKWAGLASRLARAGLCAYTFTDNPLVVDGHPVEWAVFSGDIRHSSKTLDSVVDRVLAATGAPAVNLVGYSQGSGPLPHHYIRELGGDRVVEQLIGTGASNHGPRAHSAADRFDVHPEMRHGYSRNAGKTNALAWEQQISGSMLLNELTIGDITRPGVRYTFLGTRHDNAVLPH